MRPSTQDRYYGIEIECFSDKRRDAIRKKITELGLESNVDAGGDGSIMPNGVWTSDNIKAEYESMHGQLNKMNLNLNILSNQHWNNPNRTAETYSQVFRAETEYYTFATKVDAFKRKHYKQSEGVEFRVLVCERELTMVKSKMKELFAWMQPDVNNSCGLHVHLDMRNFSPETAVKNLIKARAKMRKMVAKERLNNKFCKAVTPAIAMRALKGKSSVNRYKDINVCAYKEMRTIEIRLKEGSVDLTDIFGWVDWLQRVAYGKTMTKQTLSYQEKAYAKHKSAPRAARAS